MIMLEKKAKNSCLTEYFWWKMIENKKDYPPKTQTILIEF